MRCCIPTLLAVITVLLSAVHGVFLPLERSIPPTSHRVEVAALRARDRARHARMLRGVVDFSVHEGKLSEIGCVIYKDIDVW